jgi:hypothetical protein
MHKRKLTGIKGLQSPKPSNKPSVISQKNKQTRPITLPRVGSKRNG